MISNEYLKKINLFSNFTNQQYDYINEHGKQIVLPEKKIGFKTG